MASVLLNGLLCLLLAWASLADLRWGRIPNACTMGGALLMICVQAASGAPIAVRLLAGIATFVPLASISLLRPGSLGMGDAKLSLLIALAVGPLVLIALAVGSASALFACVPAAATRGRDRANKVTVALAPHLAIGAILAAALVE